MAAPIIKFDSTKSPMAEVVSALRGIRDNVTRLKNARAVMIDYCGGDGNVATAANWAMLASTCGFQAGDYADSNAAAAASFAEVDSLYGKLSAASGVGDATGAALDQACGKHGV